MASLVGSYQHERSENLEEYFKAIGVPYLVRKMLVVSSPKIEIKKGEDDHWIISVVTLLRTVDLKFKFDEEFQESMPSGVVLKNVATLEEDGSISISSVAQDDTRVKRKYELKDDMLILTMTHEQSGQVSTRYFKRIP